MRRKHENATARERHSRRRRRMHTARTIVETSLNAIALASLARRIGPKRLVRVAALATGGYLDRTARGRR